MTIFNKTILYGGLALLVLQALAAFQIGMLTPSQMMRNGRPKGLPFFAHGGMWGDLLVTALAAHLISRYGAEWTTSAWMLMLVAGGIMSAGMHWVYTHGTTPEAHVLDHGLTAAGWIHAVYMTVALAILLLFYLGTRNPSPTLMWWTTGLLTLHLAIGNHFVLGLLAPEWYPDRPLANPTGWATVLGGGAILFVVTWLRVGLPS